MDSLDVFSGLANPVRRRILEILLGGPSTVNTLAAQFDLHRPAVSEHLQVLRNAGLVRDERRGRERLYHVEPQRLTEVKDWLAPFENYWRERIAKLSAVLDEEKS